MNFFKKNLLLILILAAILIGFFIGVGLKNVALSKTENVLWFTLPGKLFIRALEMLILPVIFIGVVAATSSLSAKNNVRMTVISFGKIKYNHFSLLFIFPIYFVLI